MNLPIKEEQLTKLNNMKERINIKNENFCLYISGTSNNTIASFADFSGNIIISRSCGMLFPKTKREKSSDTANLDLGDEMYRIGKIMGIENILIILKGWTRRQKDVIKCFAYKNTEKKKTKKKNKKKKKPEKTFKILDIIDITKIPYNGCRRWKSRIKQKRKRLKAKNEAKRYR